MERCRTLGCFRIKAINTRGLCLVCYSSAKKKVESQQTTWEKLEELGLVDKSNSPFDDAYSQAMEDV